MELLKSLEYQYYINHHKNPFVKYGLKCYSQTDEDGLTLEILRRISPEYSEFLELGVGDGTECNTLVLAALGWTGQWISYGDIKTAFQNYTNAFITRDNILDLINVKPTLLSIDLDGNDYHILREILREYLPEVIILEYNALFIPPIDWVMPYDEKYVWTGGDYFGASLQAYVNLLKNYFLVACNAGSGGNAFFVRKDYDYLFKEVKHLRSHDIYVPPRYITPTGTHTKYTSTINTFL